jgi:hypothetical protein
MDPVELYNLLGRKPFQPVRVHLKDGRFYDIPVRQLAIVGMDDLDIGLQAPDEPPGIMSWYVTVQLDEIRSVEPLPSEAAPTPS